MSRPPLQAWSAAEVIAEPGPLATTLLLVRHAETDDNVHMRLSGWTDTDLSARGESQIELLADHFNREHGHIDALYASPLIRARRTAEAIGALTGHAPILLDDLREMYFGVIDDIASRHPGRPVGIVTHGGVIATLLTILHGESPANWRKWVVPNASLSEIVWDRDLQSGALLRHGDATHLAALSAFEA